MLREFEKKEIGYRAILKCYTQIIITKLLRGFSHANNYTALMLGDAVKRIIDKKSIYRYFKKLTGQTSAQYRRQKGV